MTDYVLGHKDNLRDFIEEFADLVDNNDLEALFRELENEHYTLSRALREFLGSEYGIDIYNFINYIPKYAYIEDNTLTTFKCPDHIEEIGGGAFWGCEALEHIDLPKSLTAINESAFNFCKSLKEIKIPKGVTYIGGYAFYRCESLREIKIPKSVTHLGNIAFAHCDNIDYLEIPRIFESRIGTIFPNLDIEQINYI